jgi:hypothetical protein
MCKNKLKIQWLTSDRVPGISAIVGLTKRSFELKRSASPSNLVFSALHFAEVPNAAYDTLGYRRINSSASQNRAQLRENSRSRPAMSVSRRLLDSGDATFQLPGKVLQEILLGNCYSALSRFGLCKDNVRYFRRTECRDGTGLHEHWAQPSVRFDLYAQYYSFPLPHTFSTGRTQSAPHILVSSSYSKSILSLQPQWNKFEASRTLIVHLSSPLSRASSRVHDVHLPLTTYIRPGQSM